MQPAAVAEVLAGNATGTVGVRLVCGFASTAGLSSTPMLVVTWFSVCLPVFATVTTKLVASPAETVVDVSTPSTVEPMNTERVLPAATVGTSTKASTDTATAMAPARRS